MNEVTYAMTQTRRLEKYPHVIYGESARIYVNGDWRFSATATDEWNGMAHVTMFTQTPKESADGLTHVAGFHMLPTLMHENLTELAQVFPPF